MQRGIKISIAAGISSGILAGIIFSLYYGMPVGIAGGLLTGLIAGAVLSFIMGPLHEMSVKKITGDGSEGSTGVYHQREIEIPRTFDESFNLCIRSLDLICRCRVKEKDHSVGRIIAGAGLNWKTWGDTILFEISAAGEGSSRIRVSSRPTARTTIVDFGKNLQNVHRIVSFLEGDDLSMKKQRSKNG
jgi:hypothetical protein